MAGNGIDWREAVVDVSRIRGRASIGCVVVRVVRARLVVMRHVLGSGGPSVRVAGRPGVVVVLGARRVLRGRVGRGRRRGVARGEQILGGGRWGKFRRHHPFQQFFIVLRIFWCVIDSRLFVIEELCCVCCVLVLSLVWVVPTRDLSNLTRDRRHCSVLEKAVLS